MKKLRLRGMCSQAHRPPDSEAQSLITAMDYLRNVYLQHKVRESQEMYFVI